MAIPSTDAFSLESYGHDLTQFAREAQVIPLNNYNAVVTRIFDILLRTEKTKLRYNPLLVKGSEEDEIRWLRIILEVLLRLATGEVPDPFRNLQVIAPNFAAMCSISFPASGQETTETKPHYEKQLAQLLSWPSTEVIHNSDVFLPRLEAFFSTIARAENHVVLLLNDFHRLVGGEPMISTLDMQNMLVPALARRQIQLVGVSTLPAFQRSIEREAGIETRVQLVALRSDEEIGHKAKFLPESENDSGRNDTDRRSC